MTLPLQGKRIVVTRPRAQSKGFVRRLETLGATIIELPTIEIVPPADEYAALDGAIARLDTFDWLVLTSANGVEHFWRRLAYAGLDVTPLTALKVAAIGTATVEALQEKGVTPDLLPEKFVAESLLAALTEQGMVGQRFLLAHADIARDALQVGLEAAGALVTAVDAYQTIAPTITDDQWTQLNEGVDVLTFTSSSTVRNFVAMVGADEAEHLTYHAEVAVIGPITAQTAKDLGLRVTIEAEPYTTEGLVDAILHRFREPV